MPPKKKLDKKALRRKQEEERLLQEELVRQEKERIRLLEEEERHRKEEEARIKAEENQKRSEQEAEIADFIRRVSILCTHKYVKEWEQKRWNDYLYKTKEMDSLKLPVVNAFITDWKDDPSYEIESIVQTSHCCLQIADEISSAIFACPEVYAKTRLWNEGIANLKKAIERKLDFASFMLLKDAYLYLDEQSQNMEYGFSKGQITLCLWANIHRTVREHGMERNGFRFWIPPHLASEDCAVRILQLSFPPSLEALSPPKDEELEEDAMAEGQLKSNELIQENIDIVLEDIPTEKTIDAENDVILYQDEEKIVDDNMDDVSAENLSPTIPAQKSEAKVSLEVIDFPPGDALDTENGEKSVEDAKYSIDIAHRKISEPEEKFLDLNEYFLVGGLLHFNHLEVPKLTVRHNGLTFIHREEPKLKRKKFKPKPPDPVRLLPGDSSSEKCVEANMTTEATQEEPDESDSNEDNNKPNSEPIKRSIGLQMPLADNVTYMRVPQPALFNPDQNAFSTEGIAVVDYSEEESMLTFETEKFGIFGMFQKLYCNFPYKSWQLNAGKIVELFLVGNILSLRIAISEKGCRLESIKPGKIAASELLDSDAWMTPEQLIQKLLSVGINIAYRKKAAKFIGISQKKIKLEEDIYNSIALLSEEYDFAWSKWNRKLPSGGIALNYRPVSDRKKENYNLVLIRKERTVQLKQEEKMEIFSNEPADSQKFSGTLYHLVKSGTPETLEEIASRSGCIQDVRLLLQKCRILSSA